MNFKKLNFLKEKNEKICQNFDELVIENTEFGKMFILHS